MSEGTLSLVFMDISSDAIPKSLGGSQTMGMKRPRREQDSGDIEKNIDSICHF